MVSSQLFLLPVVGSPRPAAQPHTATVSPQWDGERIGGQKQGNLCIEIKTD